MACSCLPKSHIIFQITQGVSAEGNDRYCSHSKVFLIFFLNLSRKGESKMFFPSRICVLDTKAMKKPSGGVGKATAAPAAPILMDTSGLLCVWVAWSKTGVPQCSVSRNTTGLQEKNVSTWQQDIWKIDFHFFLKSSDFINSDDFQCVKPFRLQRLLSIIILNTQ